MNLDKLEYQPETVPEAFEKYVNEHGVIDFTQDYEGGPIPYMFLAAEQYLRKTGEIPMEYNETNRRVREVSMKESCEKKFGTNPNIRGPIFIDPNLVIEWEKKKAKEEAEKAENDAKIRQKHEKEMVTLIIKRTHLYSKLSKLNIKRKGDAEKIAKYNAKILTITNKLLRMEKEYGINIKDLYIEEGSKVAGFFYKAKRVIVKTYKKVKKFVKKYAEPIVACVCLIASFFVPKFLRRFIPKPTPAAAF